MKRYDKYIHSFGTASFFDYIFPPFFDFKTSEYKHAGAPFILKIECQQDIVTPAKNDFL